MLPTRHYYDIFQLPRKNEVKQMLIVRNTTKLGKIVSDSICILAFLLPRQQNLVICQKPWRDFARRCWNSYIDLTQTLKSLPINENVEEYLT